MNFRIGLGQLLSDGFVGKLNFLSLNFSKYRFPLKVYSRKQRVHLRISAATYRNATRSTAVVSISINYSLHNLWCLFFAAGLVGHLGCGVGRHWPAALPPHATPRRKDVRTALRYTRFDHLIRRGRCCNTRLGGNVRDLII